MHRVFVAFVLGACVPQPEFVGLELPPPGYITVEFAGTGKGHVVSDPVGIDCPTACTAPFVPGTIVTLAMTADTGTMFLGWSGSCSGVDACTVDTSVGTRAIVDVACEHHDETTMNPGDFTISVPSCVTQMTLDVLGGQGGAAGTMAGGRGGAVRAEIEVTPGETMLATVGGGGSPAPTSTAGSNGGGTGMAISSGGGGGGGGASDVRRGGTTAAHRIIVAGGGGGAVECDMHTSGIPGAAGGADAGESPTASICTSGGSPTPAKGGTQSSAGAGGQSGTSPTPCSGLPGVGERGGNGCGNGGAGAGGGGGFFGGGGGAWGPGAGGSNLAPPNATSDRGVSSGNGSIRVQW
jgi:hypothetical protein